MVLGRWKEEFDDPTVKRDGWCGLVDVTAPPGDTEDLVGGGEAKKKEKDNELSIILNKVRLLFCFYGTRTLCTCAKLLQCNLVEQCFSDNIIIYQCLLVNSSTPSLLV